MNCLGLGCSIASVLLRTIQPARRCTTLTMSSEGTFTGADTRTPSAGSSVISIVFLRRRLRSIAKGIVVVPKRTLPLSATRGLPTRYVDHAPGQLFDLFLYQAVELAQFTLDIASHHPLHVFLALPVDDRLALSHHLLDPYREAFQTVVERCPVARLLFADGMSSSTLAGLRACRPLEKFVDGE